VKYTDRITEQTMEIEIVVDADGRRTVATSPPPPGARVERVVVSWWSGPPVPDTPMTEARFKQWLEVLETLNYKVKYEPNPGR
jgi:hypothetical protein